MPEDRSARLGRGLAALIGDAGINSLAERGSGTAADARRMRFIPIEHLNPNPNNPRRHFAESDLAELADSVKERGLLQPILARRRADGALEIVAGERRWRAAQKAGLPEVPVITVSLDDREALEVAIVENVQRADLNPLEEARGYERLIEEFAYSQGDLARIIGKSRAHVTNTLRLLKLTDGVRARVESGELTAGHARALLTSEDPEGLAARVVDEGMSVRDAEALAKGRRLSSARETDPAREADRKALESRLTEALGLTVSLVEQGPERGELRIRYSTLEQLDAVCHRLRRGSA
jgi:ParB family chromosome partitioning protein